MALTKEERDNLSDDDFAVPGKRELPMHDDTHAKMAWKMVDKTKDLTPDERKTARSRILHKAKSLGIDTNSWNVQAMKFAASSITIEAMALDMPHVKDHPNKIPFSGVLARVDEPSDNPLGGSMGKLVVLPSSVAEKALASLMGMAVDLTPDLDGHDAQRKVGLITEATIEGNAICIKGFFYGADFPDEVKRIKAESASLGFSYEAQARIKSLDDDILEIESCIFTGAAVLYKDAAAYMTTSLAAKKAVGMEKTMSDEILKALAALQAQVAELKASAAEAKVQASSVLSMVKPHADALRSAADGMAKAGIGMHEKNGHVRTLHSMADHMESEASLGKMPHVYQTSDWFNAAADKQAAPVVNSEIETLKELVKNLNTKFEDVSQAKFAAAAEPQRKTMSPEVKALLAKNGFGAQADEGKLATIDDMDKLLASRGITDTRQRIAAKLAAGQAGLIQQGASNV